MLHMLFHVLDNNALGYIFLYLEFTNEETETWEVKNLTVGDIVGMQQTTISLEPYLFHYTILPLLKLHGMMSCVPEFLLLRGWINEVEKVDQGAPWVLNLCLLLLLVVGKWGEDRAIRNGSLTHHWSKWSPAASALEVWEIERITKGSGIP